MLVALDDIVPRRGRALDLAGGAGRHAIWLAQRGLDVTIADVSATGLGLAREAAARAGVTLDTREVDLDAGVPAGPWDLIVVFHFLSRPLMPAIADALAPGGLLIYVQPTKRNLERHPRPPAPFLVDEGELVGLIRAAGLAIDRWQEGWSVEDRHEAVVVAHRVAPVPRG